MHFVSRSRSRRTIITAALLSVSGTALLAPPVKAQDISLETAAEEDDVEPEDIFVTGSRLRRDPNLGSASPIVTIEAETIRGGADVTEALREVPALASSVTSAQTLDAGELASGGAVGAATLNLRGLGAERTLVLVNGRRHVAGVAESAIVDINSIPPALIENVEVLTGGASAVYGADAVTGVVNFVLEDDFDGVELGAQGGISGEGDGARLDIYAKLGKNFGDGRGNITLVGEYMRDDGLRFGDRAQYRDGNISDDGPNPFLRFQQGDLGGSGTPNFNAFYNPANGRFPFGFIIPTPGSSTFDSIFSGGVSPTAQEQALIDRAQASPTRLIAPQYQFSITSAGGLILPANFSDPGLDLNGNGNSDCLDSFTGFNGLLDFSGSFGIVGGCWLNTENGVEVVEDGLVASNFNAFGGNAVIFDNNAFLVPQIDRFAINLLSDYDISDSVNAFFEGKYVRQETTFGTALNSFYDLLTVAPDNPFIPPELQPVADNAGGLFITRDPIDLGPNIDTTVAETWRFVGGLEGSLTDEIGFSVSANWGRYETVETNNNNVLLDRFFAAIDVTSDAQGNPVCRSELDPTVRSPSTLFGIPTGEFGYLTFVPGQGECQPANLFGIGTISQEAIDFITTTTTNRFETEQLVLLGIVNGDTSAFLNLPYDAIDFAFGFEYRDESSFSTFDPLVRGILPVTTADGNAGDFVGDLGFSQTSLATPPDEFLQDSGGSFDVVELFGEIGTTLLSGVPAFEELRLELAGRYSDYSTVGGVWTYAVNGFWAPIDDLRFRGTYSRAVRAPNISELFAPPQAAFFRPFDPCDQTEIDALVAIDDPNVQNRIANCRADGIPEGFSDPLSARFAGTISGNPDLREETADTITLGAVLQPSFIPGLGITVDYYNIEIDEAISTIAAQDVVDNCYDSATFPNDFCTSFTRNRDPNSAQFLGFASLNLSTINFVQIQTAGIDASVSYSFAIGEHGFDLSAVGSWVDRIDFFFDPTDPEAIDPELGEIGRPEWSGTASVGYTLGSFRFGYSLQYLSEMGLGDVEIETVDAQFGPIGIADEYFIHDLSASYTFMDDRFEVYGGVNNLTDEQPFVTERAYPVNPVGRFFYAGVRATF
ncbi:TonB-dependent receptor domain-containing protein [Erythrobacter sp. HL-111]|uniref:TonB-dependent receptor domain-containing protein n=1 Tax=Erythrobacter sp. HL-111 TaxID=1798193 RepID=UPI0006D9FD54|nr:TonB-dependent receptor [Erythrobacter sp. HL-111]KPP88213.1 MAG: TonB-dependent receptor [Erythrobacteraceae bacterium HL-111]SDS95987.1 TonB-dependent Receptor Plug Domain [Erythrobacter sp. HL-111]